MWDRFSTGQALGAMPTAVRVGMRVVLTCAAAFEQCIVTRIRSGPTPVSAVVRRMRQPVKQSTAPNICARAVPNGTTRHGDEVTFSPSHLLTLSPLLPPRHDLRILPCNRTRVRLRRDHPDTQKRRIDARNSKDTERGTVETKGERRKDRRKPDKRCAHNTMAPDSDRHDVACRSSSTSAITSIRYCRTLV